MSQHSCLRGSRVLALIFPLGHQIPSGTGNKWVRKAERRKFADTHLGGHEKCNSWQ